MKIVVINGTEKKGITYKLKEIFLERFKNDSTITEYYLPKDCPSFCLGCTQCFLNGENLCKDRVYIEKIEKSLIEADLLVFTSPAYVFHATGAMKALLDHFGYRWMPHRPIKEMFSKRAVIITQCLGSGAKQSAKDIKDSLSWWGVSYIKMCSFRLFSDIHWENLKDKKKKQMEKKLDKLSKKMHKINYNKKAHTKFKTKMKFYIVRILQKSLGKENPEYKDYKYWKSMGWIDNKRPWKE